MNQTELRPEVGKETLSAPCLERAPHIRIGGSLFGMYADVLLAIIPSAAFGVVLFGIRALLVMLSAVFGALVGELAGRLIFGRKAGRAIFDWDGSALVTGLLLGVSLTAGVPLWLGLVGGFLATFACKYAFGGPGKNWVNPAVAARLLLAVTVPSLMNRLAPVGASDVDLVSSATPLDVLASGDPEALSLHELLWGLHPGAIGETAALLLLAGGLYLMIRRVSRWEIPVSAVAVFGLLTALFPVSSGDGWLFLADSMASGGFMLAVFFMLPDPVTSPMSRIGRLLYGGVFGLVLFLTRTLIPGWEGAAVAVLAANLLARPIDRLVWTVGKKGMKA